MNWKNIIRKKTKSESRPVVRDFDAKLVRKLRHKFFPNWRQFCYIGKFLSSIEKIIILIASLAIIASLIGWILISAPKHFSFTPKSGGEYSEALIGQPKMINPIFSPANDVDSDITPLLYARLFKIGDNQKMIPELAISYSVSEDSKTYTVKLRENAVWTDGEKIDADDVVFTFDTIQNPEIMSPLYPAFNGVKIEKINQFEISFTLKEPYAPFASSLAIGIIPEHIFGLIAPSNLRLAKDNLQPKVTSGAWKFSKMTKNESGIETYVVERNERYFGSVPYIKKITFKFYQDFSPAADHLKSRNFMGLAFVPHNLTKSFGGKNYIAYQLRLPQYTALFFNQSFSLYKDYDIRVALAKAIDRPIVMQSALGELGQIIDSPILSGFIGYHPDVAKVEHNANEAAELLDKTWPRINPEDYFALRRDAIVKEREGDLKNLPDYETNSTTLKEELIASVEETVRATMRPDQTYYRKNDKNQILSVTITTADTPEYQAAVESIALMWRAIGVQTNVKIVDGRQISREVLKGRQFEILLYGKILGNDPDPYPFWHSSQTEYPGLNLAGFSDRNVDKILEEARASTSSEIRDELYKKFQDTIAKNLPAIFLYAPTYEYLIDKEVKGVEMSNIYSPAGRFNNIANWFIKTKWSWK
jgi:peptide/nickel transport system substrate-binding protein